jgi:hypothetical protein
VSMPTSVIATSGSAVCALDGARDRLRVYANMVLAGRGGGWFPNMRGLRLSISSLVHFYTTFLLRVCVCAFSVKL